MKGWASNVKPDYFRRASNKYGGISRWKISLLCVLFLITAMSCNADADERTNQESYGAYSF